MEPNLNMRLEPAASWRRNAVRALCALAIVLAVTWGETWTIEHSAEFVVVFPAAQAGGLLAQECAPHAIPIAMLH
jgi:hypothetical protein